MAGIEVNNFENLNKEEKYQLAYKNISALLEDEQDMVANMANTAALLKEMFSFFWVGFYITKDDELVLGPFQGPVACTRIAFDKGVCGTAASTQNTILVDDVNLFPGHIACSEKSKSEIVVPFINLLKKIKLYLF